MIYIYIYICIYIYIYIRWQYIRGVRFSSEESNGCYSRKARLFEWIELSLAVKRIYGNKTRDIKRLIFLRFRVIARSNAVESSVGVWVNRVTIPASRISRIRQHWRIVIQRHSQSVDGNICSLAYVGLSSLTKELKVATRVRQDSSNELLWL